MEYIPSVKRFSARLCSKQQAETGINSNTNTFLTASEHRRSLDTERLCCFSPHSAYCTGDLLLFLHTPYSRTYIVPGTCFTHWFCVGTKYGVRSCLVWRTWELLFSCRCFPGAIRSTLWPRKTQNISMPRTALELTKSRRARTIIYKKIKICLVPGARYIRQQPTQTLSSSSESTELVPDM